MSAIRRIEAVVRREQFELVTKALDKISCPGMMVFLMQGQGRQKGLSVGNNGRKYKIPFIPKALITIFAPKESVDTIIKTISTAVRTGKIGDGKIFISNAARVIRIRTGEENLQAL